MGEQLGEFVHLAADIRFACAEPCTVKPFIGLKPSSYKVTSAASGSLVDKQRKYFTRWADDSYSSGVLRGRAIGGYCQGRVAIGGVLPRLGFFSDSQASH